MSTDQPYPDAPAQKTMIVDATPKDLAAIDRMDAAAARAQAALDRFSLRGYLWAMQTVGDGHRPRGGRGTIQLAGKYRLGVKIPGGRFFAGAPVPATSRKAAKRLAREIFGRKAIVAPAR